MDAATFAEQATNTNTERRTENVERQIRFHARASFYRGRTEAGMLRGVAKNHGYIAWKLDVARDEWRLCEPLASETSTTAR